MGDDQRPNKEDPVREKVIQNARNESQIAERTLRAWFIVYGLGVPAVILSSDTALWAMVRSSAGWVPLSFFFIGVLVQVGAEIWKMAAYRIYFYDLVQKREKKPDFPMLRNRARKICCANLVTIGLFAIGTFLIVCILWGGALRGWTRMVLSR